MPFEKKIFVAVTNDLATDQRVQKVCSYLNKHQYEVHLIGRKLPGSLPIDHLPYKTTRFKMMVKRGAFFYAFYNLRLFFFLLFKSTPHVLANDLDTLLACSCIKLVKKKTVLYYDAHEYFTEVPEIVHRKRVQNTWKKIERFGIKKVDHMYTVNASIAQLYKTNYSVDSKVVRNIASASRIPPLTMIRSEIGLEDNDFVGIIQGAGINVDRGAEEIVEAVGKLGNIELLIVGNGDVIPQLKEQVEKNNWTNIHFFDKQPYSRLMQITQLADVGFTMDKDTNINYRFSLPNKLFDFIHAGIPVIASALPEVEKIITSYGVGIITSHKIEDIQTSIQQLRKDSSQYQELKSNCKKATKELTWENETQVLKEIYLNSKVRS